MKLSPQEKMCQDFFSVDQDDRAYWLRGRTESERLALWQALASHNDLTAMDIVSLPQPFQAELCRFVCGDPQRGIGGSGRSFQIEPVGESVSVQVGSYLNRRRMLTIEKPTHVQASQAVMLLLNHGPHAPISINRDKLRETPKAQPATESTPDPDKSKGKK